MQTTLHTYQQAAAAQITVPYYTTGFKFYEINRVKYMEIAICQNGKRIYTDRFRKELKAVHEVYAHNFIKAMKAHDSKQVLAQIETSELQTIQSRLWESLISLQQSGAISQREASTIALSRFTWSKEQALQKLNELSNKLSTSNF